MNIPIKVVFLCLLVNTLGYISIRATCGAVFTPSSNYTITEGQCNPTSYNQLPVYYQTSNKPRFKEPARRL